MNVGPMQMAIFIVRIYRPVTKRLQTAAWSSGTTPGRMVVGCLMGCPHTPNWTRVTLARLIREVAWIALGPTRTTAGNSIAMRMITTSSPDALRITATIAQVGQRVANRVLTWRITTRVFSAALAHGALSHTNLPPQMPCATKPPAHSGTTNMTKTGPTITPLLQMVAVTAVIAVR